MTELPAAPVAKKVPTTRSHHGDEFVDDYEWLRDKDGADTRAHLQAENEYAAGRTAHLAGLRQAIFEEIKTRTQQTDMSVPTRRGAYWYYERTVEGLQYPLVCRSAVAHAADWTPPSLELATPVPGEELLVDCNELAAGHEFFRLGGASVTLDGATLAYATDVVGDERYTIRVRRLASGELLGEEIGNTTGDAVWSADGRYFFYTTVDDAWRPHRVWRHEVGTPAATDVMVFEESDERFWVHIHRTTSDRFVVIAVGSNITSEVWLLDAGDPTADFRVVAPRRTGVEYHVEHAVVAGRDLLLVLHNRDAMNFTLGAGPLTLSSLDELETIIPESDAVRLTSVSASASTVAVNLREGGLAQVRIISLDDDRLTAGSNIEFDETLFAAYATGFADWNQPFVRLTFNSFVTPATVFEYDPRTAGLLRRKRQAVLGGYDPDDYVQHRLFVPAADGTEIPVSLIHHRSVAPLDDVPMLLYGYGSYEISIDPQVAIPRLSLLDRGMAFAVAHIRGGGELGRRWYEDGKLLHKRNSFTDFVDVARYLVDAGWTSADRLAAMGGSAGGLLMGAVANMAPELFAAIVAIVPFVDPLTSILDPGLPLTVMEWDEWGDPLHDPEVYGYMKAYSPYENIEAKAYPAIYARTSINDTRVLYVEPAKWIAKLRAVAITERPIVFHCEMSAGHGGASGRYDAWREVAADYAWILDTVSRPDAGEHSRDRAPAPGGLPDPSR